MTNKMGLREQVKGGHISIEAAIKIASIGYNENITAWLSRRKNRKAKPVSDNATNPKKKKNQKNRDRNALV